MKSTLTSYRNHNRNNLLIRNVAAHGLLLLFIALVVSGCKSTVKTVQTSNADEVHFKIVQLNDVYEIAPLSGGQYGGMSRVAHVVDSIRAINDNTFLVMAGDFLNPSLLGTVKVDGERVRGKHMIEVMNAMDFDLATFGNHEFDLSKEDLQKRLNESEFSWTSANVFQNTDDGPSSFQVYRNADTVRVPDVYQFQIKRADTVAATVGIFSVTLDSNPREYVYYSDYLFEAKTAFVTLKAKGADMIFGLTHLSLEQDKEVARSLPEVPFIMGGHEHNHMLVPVETSIIAKADANAKTIYVHSFTYNMKTKKLEIDSQLMPITDRVASSPRVKAVVTKWNDILDEKIKEVISNPDEVVYRAIVPLDGTDSANRSRQTNLGKIVTKGMAAAYLNEVDMVIVNGGSFRLDDMLEGDVTSLDIFRVLPFGGSVIKVELKGSLLKKVLDYGESQRGTGAYLHRMNVTKAAGDGSWMFNGTAIQDETVYKVAMSDFLMKGFDIPFLIPGNEGVVSVYEPKEQELAYDIRKAVIESLLND
ncbi:MAG TPA: bifunctional metallophosphatase/5'-nucleotidase [Flavobacteriaceae bacterium]|nr:bifunctional metallophosphatase/5'-nucleotidase [Flavobacteriaceae bacterium]HBR52919.1 bifunctional metallophosphatase/5'-nucleotidase [Flavobacteriaceae bacterium]